MSSSTLIDYGEVYAFVTARILAIWPWKRREPRPSMDVETVITAAYHRIDEQDCKLKAQQVQLELRDIEIELMKSELVWLSSVLKEANIVLSDYDYMRLQQVAIKVRSIKLKSS